MLVIGEQEVNTQTVNVRTRDNQVVGQKNPTSFLRELLTEVESKK
jgi:threonyl-tRNA synthetase